MKISWFNVLNLILLVIIILLLTGVFGTQQSVKISDQIIKHMIQTKVQAALAIGENGQVSGIYKNGESISKKIALVDTVRSSQVSNTPQIHLTDCIIYEITGFDGSLGGILICPPSHSALVKKD